MRNHDFQILVAAPITASKYRPKVDLSSQAILTNWMILEMLKEFIGLSAFMRQRSGDLR
jgi:hypothetical protein